MPDSPSTPARTPLILLVGHCTPDASMLRSAICAAAPGARMESVNDRKRLETTLASADLLMINRALDGDFDVPDGVELIRTLADRNEPDARARDRDPTGSSQAPRSRPAMMLVSNYPEAQAAAQAAGALPGFGKTDLYGQVTRRLIADALARSLIR